MLKTPLKFLDGSRILTPPMVAEAQDVMCARLINGMKVERESLPQELPSFFQIPQVITASTEVVQCSRSLVFYGRRLLQQ
jgi:hypothetical protein